MRKGLAVGISEYPFGELTGCVEDAEEFAKIMKWNNGEKDGDENFQMEIMGNLTRAQLKKAIRKHFAKDEEMLLFYFSGHGVLTETGGYILTSDSEEDDPGVSMDEILKIVKRSKAKEKIIILDCCHSGAFGEFNDYDESPSSIYRGVTILTASSENQSAFQINGRGAFTNFLLEALKGGAADITGIITPGGVYAYIDKMLGLADEQRPIFKTNVSRFTILRKVIPSVPWAVLRNIIKYFPKADDKYKLDPSYEDTNTAAKGGIKPYAEKENTVIFKELQKLQSIGLVIPHDAEFMYFAAMKKKSCKLTPLGKQYWALIKRKEN
jgi:hypothetical protein